MKLSWIPDYIMIETAGMADPGPVAQTFMDDEIGDALSLDGVVTLLMLSTLFSILKTAKLKNRLHLLM